MQRTAHAVALSMCALKTPTASLGWAASLEAVAPMINGTAQLVHISAEMVISPFFMAEGGVALKPSLQLFLLRLD